MQMKKIEISIDMDIQELQIFYGNIRVGTLCFTEEPSNIHVWDLDVEVGYRRLGFGRLLMSCMKGISSGLKKPLYLYTYKTTVAFYTKLGFICQRLCKDGEYNGIKVSFNNLDETRTFESQVSDCDLIWFPSGIKEAIIPIEL
jgi:hypothetical protein